MPSDVNAEATERRVEVSPTTLARVFPEAGLTPPVQSPSRVGQLASRVRFRWKLIWTRVRFRFDDFRALRLFWIACRLRIRLIWMRLRHRDHLSK